MHIDGKPLPRPENAVPLYSWFVLIILVGVYSCNWMDRYLLYILIEPIHRELHLSDKAMGFVTGFAFSTMYSLAGLAFGRWADWGSRRAVLSLAIAGWSTMTGLTSLAGNYLTLVLARFGVASFEAGCSPTAYSLISDYFTPQFRGRAISIYSLGIGIGMWAGATFGGWANDLFGWRAAFMILSIPGLLLAIVVFLFVREPVRGGTDPAVRKDDAAPSLREGFRFLLQRRAFVGAALALGLLCVTSSSFEGWVPTYLMRVRGMNSSDVGVLTGSGGMAGIAATMVIGLLCDRLSRRDPRWYLWLPIISFALVIPSERLFFRSSGAWAYFFYCVTLFGTGGFTAPLFTVGQFLLPPRVRAFGAAAMLFILNMVGMGGGNFGVGLISDLLKDRYGDGSLETAILSLQVSSLVGIGALFYASVWLARDIVSSEEKDRPALATSDDQVPAAT